MKDTDISKFFGIPSRTLASWKIADKNNWRRKLYLFMRDRLERDKREDNREEHY